MWKWGEGCSQNRLYFCKYYVIFKIPCSLPFPLLPFLSCLHPWLSSLSLSSLPSSSLSLPAYSWISVPHSFHSVGMSSRCGFSPQNSFVLSSIFLRLLKLYDAVAPWAAFPHYPCDWQLSWQLSEGARHLAVGRGLIGPCRIWGSEHAGLSSPLPTFFSFWCSGVSWLSLQQQKWNSTANPK